MQMHGDLQSISFNIVVIRETILITPLKLMNKVIDAGKI